MAEVLAVSTPLFKEGGNGSSWMCLKGKVSGNHGTAFLKRGFASVGIGRPSCCLQTWECPNWAVQPASASESTLSPSLCLLHLSGCSERAEPSAQEEKPCSAQGTAGSKPGLQLHFPWTSSAAQAGSDNLWPFQTRESPRTWGTCGLTVQVPGLDLY